MRDGTRIGITTELRARRQERPGNQGGQGTQIECGYEISVLMCTCRVGACCEMCRVCVYADPDSVSATRMHTTQSSARPTYKFTPGGARVCIPLSLSTCSLPLVCVGLGRVVRGDVLFTVVSEPFLPSLPPPVTRRKNQAHETTHRPNKEGANSNGACSWQARSRHRSVLVVNGGETAYVYISLVADVFSPGCVCVRGGCCYGWSSFI